MLDINLSSTITSEAINVLIVQDLIFCELHKIVHLMCSSGRLIQLVIVLSFAFYSIVGSWLVLAEGQSTNNSTPSAPAQETTRVNEILNNVCSIVDSGNETASTNSVSQSVVDIRCILRETRNAISNDSANIALELVEAADKKLATAFGNSGSDSTASLN